MKIAAEAEEDIQEGTASLANAKKVSTLAGVGSLIQTGWLPHQKKLTAEFHLSKVKSQVYRCGRREFNDKTSHNTGRLHRKRRWTRAEAQRPDKNI